MKKFSGVVSWFVGGWWVWWVVSGGWEMLADAIGENRTQWTEGAVARRVLGLRHGRRSEFQPKGIIVSWQLTI